MLNISEIFKSIQGESTYAGLPCIFIRLAGCNLNCLWCDTVYAREGGVKRSIPSLLGEVSKLGCGLVEVTGGEPLIQKEAFDLVSRLVDSGFTTLVETNGTIDLGKLNRKAITIVDIKCPSSGEAGKFQPGNLAHLKPRDEIKFVIADRTDFDWACNFIAGHRLEGRPSLLFSPVHNCIEPRTLAEWLLQSGIGGRLNLQLHKYIDLP
jgi:7-carboxy-7-deazaguanine synthase